MSQLDDDFFDHMIDKSMRVLLRGDVIDIEAEEADDPEDCIPDMDFESTCPDEFPGGF